MIRSIGLMVLGLVSGSMPHTRSIDDASSFIRGELHLTRYKRAIVDLDRDGRAEVLVYADGPQDCGTGGCDLYILKKQRVGYRVVTTVSVTRLPIRLLATSSAGWRDLGVQVVGGGIRRGYEARLRFDGRTYPGNPTVAPAMPLSGVRGRIVLQ